MTIPEQVARVKSMIARLQSELGRIRDTCPHPHKEGRYKGNTGNWCPDDDSYWIDVSCPDCGKTWHVDSHAPEYKRFDGKIIR